MKKLISVGTDRNLLLLDQLIVSGCNFFAGILVARALGPDSLTSFTLIMSALYYLNSVQHSLIFSFMFSRKYCNNRVRLIRSMNVQAIVSIASFCVLSVLNLYFYITDILPLGACLSVSLFFLLLNLHEFTRKLFIYTKSYFRLFYGDVLVKLVPLLGLSWISEWSLTKYFLIASVFSAMILSVSLTSTGLKFYNLFRLVRFGRNFAKHYKFGVWLWLGSTLQWSSGYTFLYGAAFIIGPVAAGYTIALKNLFGFSSIIFQFYESFVPPRVTYGQSLYQQVKSIASLSKESFYALLFIVIILNIYPTYAINGVFGAEYIEYDFLVLPFSILVIFEFLQRPLTVLIRAHNLTKIIFKGYVINTVIALLSVYPLVTYFGELGIAFGLLLLQISLVSSFFYGFYRSKKRQIEV